MFPGDSLNSEICPSGKLMIFGVCVSDYRHTVLGLGLVQHSGTCKPGSDRQAALNQKLQNHLYCSLKAASGSHAELGRWRAELKPQNRTTKACVILTVSELSKRTQIEQPFNRAIGKIQVPELTSQPYNPQPDGPLPNLDLSLPLTQHVLSNYSASQGETHICDFLKLYLNSETAWVVLQPGNPCLSHHLSCLAYNKLYPFGN